MGNDGMRWKKFKAMRRERDVWHSRYMNLLRAVEATNEEEARWQAAALFLTDELAEANLAVADLENKLQRMGATADD